MSNKKEFSPIDFVVLWVDNQDPEWQKSKREFQEEDKDDLEINAENRYRDWNLLKYMFRAFEQFTPWVNHIYLVTCGHYPKWLNLDHPKLSLIRHDEFMPNEYLPTFSANPIELNIHRIPGLSEKFVYFNDDVFPIRPMRPIDFFKDDLPRDICVQSIIHPVVNEKVMSMIQFNDVYVSNKYVSKKQFLKKSIIKYLSPCYGRYFWRNLIMLILPEWTGFRSTHSATSFLKSTFEELWEMEFKTFHETCLHKFRDCRDINQYAVAQYQIVHGKFVPMSPSKRPYFEIGSNHRKIERHFMRQDVDLICLNDVGGLNFLKEMAFLINCFEQILPYKSKFEK